MKSSDLLIAIMLASGTSLAALESRLQLGPEDFSARVLLLSQYVDRGAPRHDDLATSVELTGRTYNFGGHLNTVLALDTNTAGNFEPLDVVELRGRVDYLYEESDYVQILPYFQIDGRPEQDNYDEPYWLGLELWYLSPYEGLEFGASAESDLNSDHGTGGVLGSRQIYQRAPLDLLTWQYLHIGDRRYHRYLQGNPDINGLTTLEVGAETVLPLPLRTSWLMAGVELHYWLKGQDQDARADDKMEAMFYIGVEWRGE